MSIQQILSNSTDGKTAYAIILKEIKAAGPNHKADLITTLRMSGDDAAMKYCLELLSDAEGEEFETALPQTTLTTLTYWSNPDAAIHLLERAKTSEHKLEYAQAAVYLAKNMMRFSKTEAKKIAKEVKALNASEDINKSADRIISTR